MSGFFGSTEATRWGGLLKQAISNVETTFDTLLDQQQNIATGNNIQQQQQQQAGKDALETDVETFVDPESGAVTSLRRPKRKTSEKPTTQSAPSSPKQPQSVKSASQTAVAEHGRRPPERTSSDLAARLAAVVNEKNRQSHSLESKAQQKAKHSSATERSPSCPAELAAPKARDTKQQQHKESKENPAKAPVSEAVAVTDEISDNKTIQEVDKDTQVENSVRESRDMANTAEETESNVTAADGDHDGCDTAAIETTSITDPSTIEEAAVAASAVVDHEANNSTTTAKDAKDPILQQREVQLLQAMQTIASLHDQIQSLQEQNEKDRKDSERRMKELLSQQQQQQQQGSSAGGMDQKQIKKLEYTIADLRQQVNTKNEQIQGLMEEGEKLSKIELKHTTAIKRLRAEKIEQEKSVAELQKKIEKTSSDLVEANGKLAKANETEKRLNGTAAHTEKRCRSINAYADWLALYGTFTETIRMLSDMTERQTKHINKLETDILGLKEQKNKTEAKLLELKESIEAERDRIHAESKEAHAAILEKEVNTANQLREELAEAQKHGEEQEQRLRAQVHELQLALQSSQSAAGLQEDALRSEIADLQKRLRQAEAGTEDVDSIVAEATSSLLQQIETLQTQHSLALKNRDHSEHGIVLRLQHAETERDEAKNELEGLRRSIADMTVKLEQAEQMLAQERLQIEKQHTLYEAERATVAKQADELSRLQAYVDQYKANEEGLESTIKARYQKIMKERLQEERRIWEQRTKTERAKSVGAKLVKAPESEESSCGSPASESPYTKFAAASSSSPAASPRSSVDTASYSSLGISASIPSSFVHTNARHLENQLSFYQTQLQNAMQSRNELSEELMTLTVEVKKLRKDNLKLQGLEKKLGDLEERYHASLELLGERTEQVEELKADIADVKEMYRNQIVELVQKMGK
ncbi:TATA element modulatory factor 1 TATA binding-domain-containing protein [Dichotomocladium elegans]|nr:TATA element modulatory factor 1 TATA binding-domain-containing protein [Dichotomocladium elegans]